MDTLVGESGGTIENPGVFRLPARQALELTVLRLVVTGVASGQRQVMGPQRDHLFSVSLPVRRAVSQEPCRGQPLSY